MTTDLDAIRARNDQEHPRNLSAYREGSPEWQWLRAAMDRRDLLAEVDRLTRERDEARATNTRLNRRLTKAEAAMHVTIEDCKRQGVSLGRMLANAGYLAIEAERDELRATVERVKALADEWDSDTEFAHKAHYADELRDALDGGESDG